MRCWHSFCILGESLEAILYHEHDKKQEPSRSLAVELARLGCPTVASRTMAGVLPLGHLVAEATYLRFATVSVDRQGDLSSLRFGSQTRFRSQLAVFS